MVYQYRQSRHDLELHTVLSAKALVQAVDHQLLKIQSTAQALSHSDALTRRDLEAFHHQARSTMQDLGLGTNVVLRDRAGRQLLNTAVNFGQPLNPPPEPLQVEAVFETGRPHVSNLFTGPILKRPLMSVDVPVFIDGKVVYALGIGVLPEHFNEILKGQSLPPNWIVGVLDQSGVFVGRTRQPEQVIGQRGSASLLKQIDLSIQGAGETITVEGTPVVTFHSRSPHTGWSVAIGIPQRDLIAPLLQTSAMLAAGMVLLFAASALLARRIGSLIAGTFQALSRMASALGAGHKMQEPALPIREARQVAADMGRAAVLLEEREATRKDSEARFKALADDMAQLAWMADRHGQILWFNQRWYDYTGAQPVDLEHDLWQEYLHADDLERAQATFKEHLRSGQPFEDTYRFKGRHGEYRWFLSNALPLRDHAGRITNWFGTHTDITPQLDTQQALQEADVRKDEFIATLAHELRNPLAPVRTAVEILKRSGPSDARLDHACKVIERQVTHMARLIDELLDVARIARGRLALDLQPCDLAAIVRETAEDYRLSMEAAGLRFNVQTPTEPVQVRGDALRLAQMVGNLLNNAAHFTEPGGHVQVQVSTDAAADEARIEVIDSGVGIEPDLMRRLFDPFSQATQDLARTKGGLGLGLALTKGLAQLQGGRLSVASAGLGLGSTFTLHLPIDHGPPLPLASPSAPAVHRPRRVLVIEDNRDAAQTLAELLKLSGNEVHLAFDGETGLREAQRFAPEVVISDIGLPGQTDGYAVARQLRADDSLKHVYLIALSGYADEKSMARAREAGFDRYLFKPVNLAELEEALDALAA